MRRLRYVWSEWLLFILWALLVNAVNVWFIGPLVQDYTILGVCSVFAMAALWLTSIPARFRRRWISFTIFSMLLGSGLASLAFYPLLRRIELGFLMALGLFLIAWLFGKIRISSLVLTIIALVGANALLPVTEWPFLTHFKVTYHGKADLLPTDLSALPFDVITTQSGKHEIVTLENQLETKAQIQQAISAAGSYPDELKNVIRGFHHRYELVVISDQNGRFSQHPASPAEIAEVNPNQLMESIFPFDRAYWAVENGHVYQYSVPTATPQQMTVLANAPAAYPSSVLSLAEATENAEMNDWKKVLQTLQVHPDIAPFAIQGGFLNGSFHGHTIHLPVDSAVILAEGSFTGRGTHQLLLEGANELQIVSLDVAGARITTTYRGPAASPLPNDIRTGFIDNSGKQAIFVNDVPAYILQANAQGVLKRVYTAPNESLRFEGSAAFAKGQAPEILTNDPSFMRDAPTRYFTSYTYSHGQLIRNWRVYHTNVVNVHTVQFEPNGPTYVVAGIFATGKFLVLERHYLPVVPVTAGLLALSVVIGWVLRWRSRGGERRG